MKPLLKSQQGQMRKPFEISHLTEARVAKLVDAPL